MIRCISIILLGLASGSLLTGCFGGGEIDRTCDEPQFYEGARDSKKITAPEGLDDLDDYKAMPVPKATAREPRPAGSPCIDLPPNVLITSGKD